MATTERQLDTADLTARVKGMYQEVALDPDHEFHFETGRPLAERLGYPVADLDRIPGAAIDSFAGVGYFLDLAAIAPGEVVLDLGSGAGTDSLLAALAAGEEGSVIGIDMTAEQLAKATEGVTCDASLWAACIGGAMRRDLYREAIEAAGFEIVELRDNDRYRFISDRADNATRKYGITSVSLLARRREES